VAPTTTAPSVVIEQIVLPGENITSGSLNLGATLKNKTGSSCEAAGTVGNQQMNIMRDDEGNVGAVYGKATMGANEVGMAMVHLGPLPIAIGAFRSNGPCDVDAVGFGAFSATPNSADLTAQDGYALYPGDALTNFRVSVTVGDSKVPAVLNLQEAYDFLVVPRPAQ